MHICVATVKPAPPVHLEIQKHRSSFYGVLRSSFRQDGKVRHSNHGRIVGLALEQLQLIQAAFRGDVVPKDSPDAFQILFSKEYGASHTLLALAKELGLPQMIYSRHEPWVNDCLAMIIGRLLYAGSKLSLARLNPSGPGLSAAPSAISTTISDWAGEPSGDRRFVASPRCWSADSSLPRANRSLGESGAAIASSAAGRNEAQHRSATMIQTG